MGCCQPCAKMYLILLIRWVHDRSFQSFKVSELSPFENWKVIQDLPIIRHLPLCISKLFLFNNIKRNYTGSMDLVNEFPFFSSLLSWH